MHDPLKELVRELRSEKCPDSVLESVARRISRDSTHGTRPHSRLLRHSLAWVAVTLVILAVLGAWQWPSRQEESMGPEAMTQAERELVIEHAQDALAYIGQTLIQAGAHTESTIADAVIPRLRNSFHTVKAKVTNPI